MRVRVLPVAPRKEDNMIKYLCDICSKGLPEPYCLYTMGWILCAECHPKFVEENTVNGILILPVPVYWNKWKVD
jgi:hypothetical protein